MAESKMISVGSQFELEKIIHDYFKLFIMECNFAMPAMVVAVNAGKQMVDVRPSLMKKYQMTGDNISRPVICNVPFQFPRGGDSYVTLPIKPGDEGLLIFSMRDISTWKEFGGLQALPSSRILDYNDAIFIAGISSQQRKVPDYDADNITIVKNGKKVTVKDGILDAPDYHINCKSIYASSTIDADGKITSTIDCVSGTISGATHTHGGVTGGHSNTGVPE